MAIDITVVDGSIGNKQVTVDIIKSVEGYEQPGAFEMAIYTPAYDFTDVIKCGKGGSFTDVKGDTYFPDDMVLGKYDDSYGAYDLEVAY